MQWYGKEKILCYQKLLANWTKISMVEDFLNCILKTHFFLRTLDLENLG